MGGAEDCASPIVIYRKCTQWILLVLYWKNQVIRGRSPFKSATAN